jgi:hypothetical protein
MALLALRASASVKPAAAEQSVVQWGNWRV